VLLENLIRVDLHEVHRFRYLTTGHGRVVSRRMHRAIARFQLGHSFGTLPTMSRCRVEVARKSLPTTSRMFGQ